MNYVYENGYAIGYLNGDKLFRFSAPIRAALLLD